jgi:hypothetical protein
MAEEQAEFDRQEVSARMKWLVTRLAETVEQTDFAGQDLIPFKSAEWVARTGKGRCAGEVDLLGLVAFQERWGTRIARSLIWIVEAGMVLGSSYVVWKYLVEMGVTQWGAQRVVHV